MRYSNTTKGFYPIELHYDNLPDDLIDITPEEYQAYSEGNTLSVDANNQLQITPRVISLDALKQGAIVQVDNTAGMVRERFITNTAGQELTYQEKADQAADFAAANYPVGQLANYPFIQVEINVTGLSAQDATDAILARRAVWVQKGSLIEEARLIGKRDINIATNASEIDIAKTTAINTMLAIQ